ncbi:AAA family ATPase [Sulfidibacter corallicola]|uniref:AAA family ATPase n=1 Tax=Sulfidibacter corallicola TaxID=2818388 RepID=A0A8A4TD71_SULCO|nr:AAA family ATPase [Sulfidibacter corallicola]QTD47527.1 AAA family ATPase [Sulfidibacter corallicola]
MATLLKKLTVDNYRSIQKLELELGDRCVFFGPNGSGKSSLLDTLWFVRDCFIRGVDQASSRRGHGIGMRWDGADPDDQIRVGIETTHGDYGMSFGFAKGRIDAYVGEILHDSGKLILKRSIGSAKVSLTTQPGKFKSISLPEPEKPALTMARTSGVASSALAEVDNILRRISYYHARSMDLHALKWRGSESSPTTLLSDRCGNLWSVIRNLNDKRDLDHRYQQIVAFMKRAFPEFNGFFIEQTGPSSLYAYFQERHRSEPIMASGVSDGYLTMLILLTALFSMGTDVNELVIFDEPDISLHPHALSVFADAVKLATREWGKQVLIATHSPVLISQFQAADIYAMSLGGQGEALVTPLTQIDGIGDLLEDYSVGSLYMAEVIAPQSKDSEV